MTDGCLLRMFDSGACAAEPLLDGLIALQDRVWSYVIVDQCLRLCEDRVSHDEVAQQALHRKNVRLQKAELQHYRDSIAQLKDEGLKLVTGCEEDGSVPACEMVMGILGSLAHQSAQYQRKVVAECEPPVVHVTKARTVYTLEEGQARYLENWRCLVVWHRFSRLPCAPIELKEELCERALEPVASFDLAVGLESRTSWGLTLARTRNDLISVTTDSRLLVHSQTGRQLFCCGVSTSGTLRLAASDDFCLLSEADRIRVFDTRTWANTNERGQAACVTGLACTRDCIWVALGSSSLLRYAPDFTLIHRAKTRRVVECLVVYDHGLLALDRDFSRGGEPTSHLVLFDPESLEETQACELGFHATKLAASSRHLFIAHKNEVWVCSRAYFIKTGALPPIEHRLAVSGGGVSLCCTEAHLFVTEHLPGRDVLNVFCLDSWERL